MGAEVARNEWSNEQRRRYREKIVQNLDVFERMLVTSSFDHGEHMTGMEVERHLVDDELRPSYNNAAVLEAIDNAAFQTELAQFNIECNVDPGCFRATRCGSSSRTCATPSTGPGSG